MSAITANPPTDQRPGPGLLIVLGFMGFVGAYLWWGQNIAGHPGGPISIQKAVWFALAVSLFIWMPVFILLDTRVAPLLRRIVAVHVILWIIRALVELWLCYGVHLWVPPYGVIHNLTSFALLSFLMWRYKADLAPFTDPATMNAKRYLAIMRVAMLCECVFAEMFFATVNYDTANTWFANTEPRFWLINMLTLVADALLLPALLLTVRDYYGVTGGSNAPVKLAP